jgi:hypothetical protein
MIQDEGLSSMIDNKLGESCTPAVYKLRGKDTRRSMVD